MTRAEQARQKQMRENTILNSSLTNQNAFTAYEAARVLKVDSNKAKHFLRAMCLDGVLEKIPDPLRSDSGVVYRTPQRSILSMDWRVDHSVYDMLETSHGRVVPSE